MPAFAIDQTTYRKDAHLPVGVGWSMRPGGIKPTTIVIHTTSAAIQNTSFDAEARYLYNSREVSAHYLNGKAGQIVQFLNPDLEAWHAGAALTSYANLHSIGIENHVSVGETWTDTQHDSLTWLVKLLMERYTIAPSQIETHRAIALPGPNIRKHDPTSWDDASFYAWRDALASPPFTKLYRVRRVMVSQRQEGGAPYAGELQPGQEVLVDKWYTNGYVHLASGLGFVKLADLEPL